MHDELSDPPAFRGPPLRGVNLATAVLMFAVLLVIAAVVSVSYIVSWPFRAVLSKGKAGLFGSVPSHA